MTVAAIWFGWWLCWNIGAGTTVNTSVYCIPTKTYESCQKIRDFSMFTKVLSACVNNETGERK